MKTVKYPDTYMVWDLETSGLDKEKCKILEIGCMSVVAGEPANRMSWVLNHGIEIPEEITRITGITKEIIQTEGVEPAKALGEFLYFFERTKAHLTHNGMRFDIEWLAYHAAKTLGWSVGRHKDFLDRARASAIDTAVLVKAGKIGAERMWNDSFEAFSSKVMNTIAKGVKYNVAVCCEELGIDRTGIQQHRALGDVELTNLIYRKLLAR